MKVDRSTAAAASAGTGSRQRRRSRHLSLRRQRHLANRNVFAQAQSNESRISVANQRATKLLKDWAAGGGSRSMVGEEEGQDGVAVVVVSSQSSACYAVSVSVRHGCRLLRFTLVAPPRPLAFVKSFCFLLLFFCFSLSLWGFRCRCCASTASSFRRTHKA